ncbi:caspase family protein [Glycomyces harbinensis]|uniref:caspase family protein n=1 Tax=Glycomyces harbinensis TaxID=58114 RepID=UPI000B826BBE|nr:caspase family protein [Glycomyces harbinensis]
MKDGGRTFPLLEFDAQIEGFRDALKQYRYTVRWDRLTEHQDIEPLKAVRALIEDNQDLRIVHVIGHGTEGVDRFLHLVPPSGTTCTHTNLNALCQNAQTVCANDPQRDLLIILDVCHAGTAVDRLGLEQSDQVWFAAAATPGEGTLKGHFTTAFAKALKDITDGWVVADPGREYIKMSLLREVFAEHFQALMAAEGVIAPKSKFLGKWTTSPEPESTVIPNPRYTPEAKERSRARAGIDPAMREYLDAGLDIGHFHDRVGRNFTGRGSILDRLGTWLGGEPHRSELQIVTGSAGVGKSTVLGAIVLTQHPHIDRVRSYQTAIRTLRRRFPESLRALRPAGPVAAVHARQRRFEEIVGSFIEQLRTQIRTPPPDVRDHDAFIAWISRAPEPPLLILDALDESINPPHISDTLLRGLMQAGAQRGRPVCRLLVAGRNADADQRMMFTRLKRSALGSNEYDLDGTPPEELRKDLTDFLLREFDTVAPGASAGTIDTIAERTAAVLSAGDRDSGYGAFMVAALFARYLNRAGLLEDGGDAVDRALDRIPRSLPGVLEMDLANEHLGSSPQDRRAVLAALAHAKGTGMPVSVVDLLGREVFEAGPHLDTVDLLTRSTDVKVYLRTDVDPSSGEVLFRLFHQGLADHLAKHPRNPPSGRRVS